MESFALWQFLAGVAMFVYAMLMVERALKNLAGRPFKKFLQKHSRSKIKTIATSTLVTAVLQSSSVVILMVLSFVGAGLIKTTDALAATLGSNLGTTLDGWLIALVGFKFNFYQLSFTLLSVSLIGLLFFKPKTKWAYVTSFLMGFSFLFIGLEWMKQSVDDSVADKLEYIKHWHYLWFIPVGCIITAIIQSSSAVMAMALTVVNGGVLPFEHAACIILGAEIGTTLKFLLGSVGGSADKKRVAWGNFISNAIEVVLATIFLWPILNLIQHTFDVKDPLTGLVIFQTGINAASIILFIPLLHVGARWLERVIKEKDGKGITKYIYRQQAALPGDALELGAQEIRNLMEETIGMSREVVGIKDEKQNKRKGIFGVLNYDGFDERYEKLKMLQGEILEYLSAIPNDEMSAEETGRREELIEVLRHVMRAGKNMKDIRHNLEEFASSANDVLFDLYQKLQNQTAGFYNEYLNNLEGDVVTNTIINQLLDENRNRYNGYVAELVNLTACTEISNVESSSYINVYREIYSSNKALILSLAGLKGVQEGE